MDALSIDDSVRAFRGSAAGPGPMGHVLIRIAGMGNAVPRRLARNIGWASLPERGICLALRPWVSGCAAGVSELLTPTLLAVHLLHLVPRCGHLGRSSAGPEGKHSLVTGLAAKGNSVDSAFNLRHVDGVEYAPPRSEIGRLARAVRYSALVAVHGARMINLRKISDPKGNLTPIEGSIDVPFEIRRVYYTYDIPGGETRGGHAHRRIQEFVVAASGSFSVTLFDGENRETFYLNRSYYGLLIPERVWRELTDFSTGSVCLVLASDHFEEAEYIRDFDEFKAVARQ
jgi:hypothetical protein